MKAGKESAREKKVRLEDYDKDMQRIIRAELKKQERTRKMLLFSCMCLALLSFGYLGFYYYEAQEAEQNYQALAQLKGSESASQVAPSTGVQISTTTESIEIPPILEEYESLYNLNKGLIGWLKIDDTNIDYPVLQAADNEYYLRRNFEQEYDKNGCIFMDKDCDVISRSTNLILYGHHMSSGTMFGKLDKYSSQSYYEDHKYIQFDTIYEKGTYEVMYVFRSRIYEEDEIVFKYYQFINAVSQAEFDSNMREMAALSLYDTGVEATYGDQLLTLSTCDYYTDYGRFVVVARRVK